MREIEKNKGKTEKQSHEDTLKLLMMSSTWDYCSEDQDLFTILPFFHRNTKPISVTIPPI